MATAADGVGRVIDGCKLQAGQLSAKTRSPCLSGSGGLGDADEPQVPRSDRDGDRAATEWFTVGVHR
ncbi:hypothetical protein Are01nite_85110 [Actinoplanes regularis]|nr:hypothetical protein Are01nite_85110 [Actinoplanes regularis]